MDVMKPFWKYDDNDTTTWKYIDCKVKNENGAPVKVSWMLNPSFAYKYIDPYYKR